MQLVDDEGSSGLSCKEVSLRHVKAMTGKLAGAILKTLGDHPEGLHASMIAKQLGEHEQKVYYHTRRLLRAGIISIHHTDDSRGGTAKVLVLQSPSFALRLREFSPLAQSLSSSRDARFFVPFIEHGRLNCKIIVGSPDPHGPASARARDANYAIDLGIFLGTFVTARAVPIVQLDTELRDWNQHLIIVGGPVVNKAAERVNQKSLARYDMSKKAFVVRGKEYTGEDVGVIVKMHSPYAKGRWILQIAGKRHTGTRAAILALITDFDRVCRAVGPVVVEGLDADSDGIIDAVRFCS